MADSQHDKADFDTDVQQLGMVYAKALLGAADREGTSDRVLSELESFVNDVLDKLPKLDAALSSLRVPATAKEQLLDRALSGKVSATLLNFLKVVAGHDRMDCIRPVSRSARKLFNEQQGRVEVTVQTAAPVEQDMLELIANKLRAAIGKDVDLTTRVDPNLIGGLLVRIGDTVYDGSVANRLARMRKEAVEKTSQQIRQNLERFAVTE